MDPVLYLAAPARPDSAPSQRDIDAFYDRHGHEGLLRLTCMARSLLAHLRRARTPAPRRGMAHPRSAV
ncbi:hypothetical protein AB0T83_04320 [Fluviibacterium sp. DFM31]|uniref:Uncharacterized protein n=1 Tax=Meridianimarinicoccus marinus TaxID=3231483 RepID=A0ABV3L3C2_9RHOB